MTEQVHLEISDEIAIQIQNMNKWFGSFHVLRDIDLNRQPRRKNRGLWAFWIGEIHPDSLHQCVWKNTKKARSLSTETELTSDLKNIDKIRSEVGMWLSAF